MATTICRCSVNRLFEGGDEPLTQGWRLDQPGEKAFQDVTAIFNDCEKAAVVAMLQLWDYVTIVDSGREATL